VKVSDNKRIKEEIERSLHLFRKLTYPILVKEKLFSEGLKPVESVTESQLSILDTDSHIDYLIRDGRGWTPVWVRNRFTGSYKEFTVRELTEYVGIKRAIEKGLLYPTWMVHSNISNSHVDILCVARTVNVFKTIEIMKQRGIYQQNVKENHEDHKPFICVPWGLVDDSIIWSSGMGILF
jgi:hypothetical protein